MIKKGKYTKKDLKYWSIKSINKYSMTIWYSLIVIMTLFIMWAIISHTVNSKPLVSPVYNPIKQAEAKEKEFISCETPKGYLECKAYEGVITWAEHETLSKIIKCESGWNDQALNKNTNGSFDLGLFQINTVHKQKNSDMLNFKKNIDFGIKLFKKQGVAPWVCSRIIK